MARANMGQKKQKQSNHSRRGRPVASEVNSLMDFSAETATKARFNRQPLQAKNEAQGQYIAAMKSSIIVFGIGPAGTGKTYVAGAYAADLLKSGRVDKIVVTRPNVEAGTPLGFLPGELEEKYEPFIAPFRDVMIDRIGKGEYQCAIKNGKISPEPLGYMRGKTFDNAVVILDEAQNTTPTEMKMFLTRIGENCLVVIDGDIEQQDIPGVSGLRDALKRLRGVEGVSVVEFEEDDIVRSGIVKEVLKAYRR